MKRGWTLEERGAAAGVCAGLALIVAGCASDVSPPPDEPIVDILENGGSGTQPGAGGSGPGSVGGGGNEAGSSPLEPGSAVRLSVAPDVLGPISSWLRWVPRAKPASAVSRMARSRKPSSTGNTARNASPVTSSGALRARAAPCPSTRASRSSASATPSIAMSSRTSSTIGWRRACCRVRSTPRSPRSATTTRWRCCPASSSSTRMPARSPRCAPWWTRTRANTGSAACTRAGSTRCALCHHEPPAAPRARRLPSMLQECLPSRAASPRPAACSIRSSPRGSAQARHLAVRQTELHGGFSL